MADVLPSCIGMEGLLYLLFSGFVQANKSHKALRFQLVRINPSGGVSLVLSFLVSTTPTFQLVRINPSGGVRLLTIMDLDHFLYIIFPISPH